MYRRFLIDSDYLSILSKEAFDQLIRDIPDRKWQAEEASEASIVEYLHDKFEIEEALAMGKLIEPYNPQITYPAGAHFIYDGNIVRATRTINGNKRPSPYQYWEEYAEPIENMTNQEEAEADKEDEDNDIIPEQSLDESFNMEGDYKCPKEEHYDGHHHRHRSQFLHGGPLDFQHHRHHHRDKARKYSQRKTWFAGDIVFFAGRHWRCIEPNGKDFDNIQIPGVCGWREIETVRWAIFSVHEVGDVVSYEGDFYALLTLDGYNPAENPKFAPDAVWGKIATYTPDVTYELSDTEWVVCDDRVYVPVMDPNASVLEESVNYARHDPRNPNIKKHLLRMAVYELHKIIAPHNISTARITDYEATMQWLQDCSRLRINPGIRRCVDKETNNTVQEYGLATFRRDYDPHKNEWQI